MSVRQPSSIAAAARAGAVLIMYPHLLIIAIVVFVNALATGNIRALGHLSVILAAAAGVGSAGGVIYAVCRRRGVGYYASWLLASEATIGMVMVEFNLARVTNFWARQDAISDSIVYGFVATPLGIILMGAFTAMAAWVYARYFADPRWGSDESAP